MSRHLRIEMAGGLSRQAVIKTLRSSEIRGPTDRALARKSAHGRNSVDLRPDTYLPFDLTPICPSRLEQ